MRSISLIGLGILVLSVSCNQPQKKVLVKTKYHLHSITYAGESYPPNEQRDTFYYNAEGKPDHGRDGSTWKDNKHDNIDEWKTFDKTEKLIGTGISFLNEQGLEDSVAFTDGTHLTYAHRYIRDSNGNVIEDWQYGANPRLMISRSKYLTATEWKN